MTPHQGDSILIENCYQMSDLPTALSDPGLISFYEYWATLCGNRAMPSRKNIDPLQVPRGYLSVIRVFETEGGVIERRIWRIC